MPGLTLPASSTRSPLAKRRGLPKRCMRAISSAANTGNACARRASSVGEKGATIVEFVFMFRRRLTPKPPRRHREIRSRTVSCSIWEILGRLSTFQRGKACGRYMGKFMYIFRGGAAERPGLSPTEMQAHLKKWYAWAETLTAEVAKLKKQPGKNIIKYGTSQLDRTLIEHKLIDEFHFSIFPIAVGQGQRLFESIDTSKLKLRLTGTKAFANGIV